MRNILILAFALLTTTCGFAHEPSGAARSPKWPAVRAAHLAKEPACVACGASGKGTSLEVHHVVPFSVDRSRELDPGNLITLCVKGGRLACNCHLTFGHVGNFQRYNPDVRRDAVRMRAALQAAEVRAKHTNPQ